MSKRRQIPEGLWKRCPGCQTTIFTKEADKRLGVCPECEYHFTIGAKASVELTVYNEAGQEVVTLIHDELTAGRHIVSWDGRDALGQAVGSGVYLYQLRVEEWEQTRKLVLLQ